MSCKSALYILGQVFHQVYDSLWNYAIVPLNGKHMSLILTFPGDHVIQICGSNSEWITKCERPGSGKLMRRTCEQHFKIWKMKQWKTVYIIFPVLTGFAFSLLICRSSFCKDISPLAVRYGTDIFRLFVNFFLYFTMLMLYVFMWSVLWMFSLKGFWVVIWDTVLKW